MTRTPSGASTAEAEVSGKSLSLVRVFRSDLVPEDMPDLIPVARYNLANQIDQGSRTVRRILEAAAGDGVDVVVVRPGLSQSGGGTAMFPLFGFGVWAAGASRRTSGYGEALLLAPSRMPIDLVFPATVVSLHSGATADNVLPGDRVLAINGAEVALGKDAAASPHLAERLRIQPGQSVTLRLLRPGVGVELGSVVAQPNPPTHLDHENWDGLLPGEEPEASDPRSGTAVWKNPPADSEAGR